MQKNIYASSSALKSPPVKMKQEPDSEPSYTVSSATENNPESILDPNVKDKVECIDLTDETPAKTDEKHVKVFEIPAKIVETPMQPNASCSRVIARAVRKLRHPAPLPRTPFSFPLKNLPAKPPKLLLAVSVEPKGILLKWQMPLYANPYTYAKFDSFEIFWYPERENMPVDSELWECLGSVHSLSLPMSSTISRLTDNIRYHFAVRAMDIYKRYGDYSNPVSVFYKKEK